MQIAFLLFGLAFLLTLFIVTFAKIKESKAQGSWYGWYEHSDPYWENATASTSAEPAHAAGDDTC